MPSRLPARSRSPAEIAAQPKELAPRPGCGSRIDRGLDPPEARLGLVDSLGSEEGLDADQFALQDLRGGRIGCAHDFVGDLERRVGRTATNRESGADDPDRPLVPLAGLPAVRAVGIGGALQARRELVEGVPTVGLECTFAVDDVDATVDAVRAAGGKILMDRFTISGVGHLVFFADPSGNPIGAMQYDEHAD